MLWCSCDVGQCQQGNAANGAKDGQECFEGDALFEEDEGHESYRCRDAGHDDAGGKGGGHFDAVDGAQGEDEAADECVEADEQEVLSGYGGFAGLTFEPGEHGWDGYGVAQPDDEQNGECCGKGFGQADIGADQGHAGGQAQVGKQGRVHGEGKGLC